MSLEGVDDVRTLRYNCFSVVFVRLSHSHARDADLVVCMCFPCCSGTAGKRKRGRNDGDGGKKSSQPKGSADAYMLIYKARGFSHPPSSALCPPQDVEVSLNTKTGQIWRLRMGEFRSSGRPVESRLLGRFGGSFSAHHWCDVVCAVVLLRRV